MRTPRRHGRRLVTLLALTALALSPVVDATAATTRVEAERAELSGGAVVATDHPGHSGTGFVGGFTDGNRGNARAAFPVSVTAGTYSLVLGYANGTGSARTLTLTVDGGPARQISLPATANWDTWGTSGTSVTLGAGSHSIAYTFGSADNGNVNIDFLDITSTTPAPPDTDAVKEAENATLSGGAAVATDHPGFTGSGFVGGYTDGNKGTARTTFQATTTSGDQSLDLRYANGTGTAMTLSLYVDGARVRQISLPATANWDTWGTASETVALSAASHSIAYAFDSGDSGNVNIDSLAINPVVVAPPAGPGEAETAFLSGGAVVATSTTGFGGAGYVTGFGTTGARVVRSVSMPAAGTATATIRFANSSGASRTLAVSANGRAAGTATLTSGTGWHTTTVSVPLRANLNTIGLTGTGTGGDVLVDSVLVANEATQATRGATLPYTQYEAEAGSTTGTVLSASREFKTVQSESSGRRAVRLTTGQSVSVTLTKPATAIVVRYSIPDSADGTGQTAPLAVYANGTKKQDLALTSAFSWVYGAYPYTNNPGEGNAHHFYDETRAIVGDLAAGTVLKLQKDSGSAAYVDVDLIDAEVAPAAATAPEGALNVTAYGAVPNNGSDATAAIRSAIAAASSQDKPLFIPAGTFRITAAITVANVKIFGAGPWHTVVQGTANRGGFFATGSNVTIADLAIFGDVRSRLDNASDAAIEGDFGTGSLLQNVWTEHTKVGMWPDSGTNGLYAVGMRVRDTFADGVNIHAKDGPTTNVRIDQSSFRNTGDDALAMFSEGQPVVNGAYTYNTVQVPLLANGIGIYGGTGNRAENNLVSDTVTASAGIAISTRFNPTPFTGTTYVRQNTLIRTGGYEPNWNSQFGALWIYADTKDITAPIVVSDLTITDSTYQGLLLSYRKTITGVTFDHVTITGAGTYGIELNAAGSASISNTTVTGAASGGLLNSTGYTLTRGGGNSGF